MRIVGREGKIVGGCREEGSEVREWRGREGGTCTIISAFKNVCVRLFTYLFLYSTNHLLIYSLVYLLPPKSWWGNIFPRVSFTYSPDHSFIYSPTRLLPLTFITVYVIFCVHSIHWPIFYRIKEKCRRDTGEKQPHHSSGKIRHHILYQTKFFIATKCSGVRRK